MCISTEQQESFRKAQLPSYLSASAWMRILEIHSKKTLVLWVGNFQTFLNMIMIKGNNVVIKIFDLI